MLKTTVPTLDIKTSGTDLALVETIFVNIKSGETSIVKSNDDIEVDNDVISVFLAQNEAAQFKMDGGASISITAYKYDGETENIKIAWAKRGSRTDGNGGGGGETESNMAWYPSVSQDGVISWTKTSTETPPLPANIKGIDGKDGTDGFSPQITENPQNTSSVYKMDITTEEGSFTTPNLKGKDGEGAGVELIATLAEVKENETSGKAADALAVKELAVNVPFRFGVDSNGNYGYYKEGADTVTPFKTGGGDVSRNNCLELLNEWKVVETMLTASIIKGDLVSEQRTVVKS